MKNKILYFVFLLSLILCYSCAKEEEIGGDKPITPAGTTLPLPHAKRTVIVYLSGDNNLSSSLSSDLEEIIEGSASLGVEYNVVAFVDLQKKKPYISHIINGKEEKLRTWENDFYSVSPDSMLSVYQWIIKNCPADEYATIIGGHGSGSIMSKDTIKTDLIRLNAYNDKLLNQNAYYYDSEGDGIGKKFMNIPSLAAVFSRLPKMKFMFFDCCCMQNLETVYELRKSADYIIAPVGEVPEDGAPYAKIMQYTVLDGRAAGEAIVKEYVEEGIRLSEAKGKQSLADCYRGICISCVNTSELENLIYQVKNSLCTITTQQNGKLTPEIHGCVYFFNLMASEDGLNPSFSLCPSLFDIKSLMKINNVPDDAMTSLLEALDKAVICRYPKNCSNFKSFTAIGINKAPYSFSINDDNYCGLSMIVPLAYYDDSPSYTIRQNKEMYKLEAIRTIDWHSFGW